MILGKKYLALIFIIQLGKMCCVAQVAWEKDPTIVNAKDYKELRIDPSASISAPQEDFIDSIEYIVLETNRESEFSQITQLCPTSKGYIIYDNNLETIFFFDRLGKYKNKLTTSKNFKQIRGFTVDEVGNRIYVDDILSEYIYVFDLDGGFKDKLEKKIYVSQFGFQDGFKVEYYFFDSPLNSQNDSTRANLAIVDKNNSEKKGYLWYTPNAVNSADIFDTRCFYNSKNMLLLARELDNNIYGFDQGKMIIKFKIILPIQYSLPIDFLSNPVYNNKRLDYLLKNQALSHKLSNVYQNSDYLTFSYLYNRTLLYHLQTGESFDFDEVVSLLKQRQMLTIQGHEIKGVDREAFITDLSFANIKDMVTDLKKTDQLKINPKLREIAKKDFHNPVLILLHLKS